MTTLPPKDPRRLGEEPVVHFVCSLGVGAYGWVLHGLFGGIAVISVLIFGIGLTNMAVLKLQGPRRALQASRWGWLGLILASLIASGRPAAERDCNVRTSPVWGLLQIAVCDDPAVPRRAHDRGASSKP
jgi:hypothetical protein